MREESQLWNLMAKGLMGDISKEERQELNVLLENNKEWKETYAHLQKLELKVETKLPIPIKEQKTWKASAFKKIEEELNLPAATVEENYNKPKKKIRFRRISIAATLVALIGLSALFFFLLPRSTKNGETVATTQNQKDVFVASQITSVVLTDGTKVWLNSGSVLKCDKAFGKKNRTVNLTGEAFFDVAQDANVPFVVHLKTGVNVKVLGTRFNVKAYENTPFIETSLLSGKIALNINKKGNQPIILKPHEKVRIDITDLKSSDVDIPAPKGEKMVHLEVLKKNPIDHKFVETAWMDNRLSFYNLPFKELGYRLKRIYGKELVFKDEQLEKYHLTGSFKEKSLKQILQVLQITTPFQYKIEEDKIILFHKN